MATTYVDQVNGSGPSPVPVDQITGAGETVAYKAPCRLASTGNLVLNGLQSIDGTMTAANDRVLVRLQTDQKQNGVWIAQNGAWQRARDFDSNRDITKGTRVTVSDGATLAGKEYLITSPNPMVVGTSNITFAETLSSDAGSSAAAAEAARAAAVIAKNGAEAAQGAAAASAGAASTSAGNAATSESNAASSAGTAVGAAGTAVAAAGAASTDADDAETARAAAVAAKNASEAAAGAASTSETNAGSSATAAAASASAAATAMAALSYRYSTTQTDADPGGGIFRLNALPASATAAYIDNADSDGVNVTGILDSWDDAAASVRGTLTIRSKSNPAVWHQFNVTGSVVDGSGYRKLTLAYVGGAGTFANALQCWLIFSRGGNDGAGVNASNVGAAIAGVSQVPSPADGDRFSGVLSGGSTLFWTTWGNIKAGLKSYFDTLYATATQGGKADTAVQPSTNPLLTTIELGHANDTTLSRGAAGFLNVEGKRVPSPASQAAGDMLYRGSTEWERLAKGTAGQVLTMNSGATAPEWKDASGSIPAYGAIGSYIMGSIRNTGVTDNSNYSGSSIQPSGFAGGSGSASADDTSRSSDMVKGGTALSGTWRSMGRVNNSSGTNYDRSTLFMRIS